MAEREEKTYAALPQKRQRARAEGNVARSRDLTAAVSFALATAVSVGALSLIGHAALAAFRTALLRSGSAQTTGAIGGALWRPLLMTTGVSGLLGGAALLGAVLQGGLVFAPARLVPDLSRLNPGAYFGRVLAWAGLLELVKAAAKISIIAIIAWQGARLALAAALRAGDVNQQLLVMAAAVRRLLGAGAVLALVTAAADYGYKRYEYEADLRMTRQELLDELKGEEGNPQMRRALRRAMRRGAKRIRGIHQAATATVVLTNPTHYAVALRYRRGFDQAPLLVAKGAGENAQRLLAIARLAAVPVMEKRQLARTLFRSVEVGEYIPRALYRAVAEVLGMILRSQADPRRQAAHQVVRQLGKES